MDPRSENERKALERALRVSRRTLPINLSFSLFGVAVLWFLHRFFGLPAWAAIALGFFAVFGAVSDVINIPYIHTKLNRLEPPPPTGSGDPPSKNRT